jgi:hypothetical protein
MESEGICGDFERSQEIAGGHRTGMVEIDFNDEKKLAELISQVSKNKSVARYLEEFQSPDLGVRLSAFKSVSILVDFGNTAALNLLMKSFKEIPPPVTIQDTHFKLEAFRFVNRRDSTDEIFPILARDLYATKSNNQTRQWISEILDFLYVHRNRKDVSKFLREILTAKQFTYRIKDKVKRILDDEGYY